MDGANYKTALDKNLGEATKDLKLGQRLTFPLYVDPNYRAGCTMEWLKLKLIHVSEWSGRNPVVNQIETMWQDTYSYIFKL